MTDDKPSTETTQNAVARDGKWHQRLRAGDVDMVTQLLLLLTAVNAIWFSWLSVTPLGQLPSLLFACLLVVAAVAHHKGWLTRRASIWLLVGFGYLNISFNTAVQGGVWSPAMAWYIVLPLPALFVLGVRAMAGVVVLSVATVFAIAWTQSQELLPSFGFSNDRIYWAAMVFSALALSVSILPLVYHSMHDGLIKDLNQKNAALQLARDELLDEQMQKDDFLASVSHELRTPMNAIIGFLQAIDQRPPADEQTQQMLGHMDHSAKHLMTIINDLLDLSQMRAGKLNIEPRRLDLHKQVNDISNTFRPQLDERGIAFRVTIHEGVPQWLMLDRDRLSQVLINLLGNAAKFTNQGHVYIDVSTTSSNMLRFDVQDSGRGIDHSHLERVFDRFSDITNRTRRAYGGTGLGLSICRQLIELQQGHIGVNSELGQGATFWFELPLLVCDAPTHSEQLSAQTDNQEASSVSGDVLIVDDSLVNRLVAKQLLLSDLPNLHIVEASGSHAALQAINQQPFDLILMDVVMPDKDGIETTAHIRATDHTTVIIGLTADVTPDVKTRCLKAGMNDVMTKPFDRQALVYRVRQGLATKAQA